MTQIYLMRFFMMGCPLGLEPCEQKPVSLDAKCYAINCENYFYCRSWVLPWALPLHRMSADSESKINPVPHDYYLVAFLSAYNHGRDTDEGLQERDWAVYFAEYGYAEACPLPRRHSYLSRVKSLFSDLPENIWKLRRIPISFGNGFVGTITIFDSIITRRPQD
jgi:hypothetical protein